MPENEVEHSQGFFALAGSTKPETSVWDMKEKHNG